MNSWEHRGNITASRELERLGYSFEISADGYFVRYKGIGLGGASVSLPRDRKLHWRRVVANRRDNLASALRLAYKHMESSKK